MRKHSIKEEWFCLDDIPCDFCRGRVEVFLARKLYVRFAIVVCIDTGSVILMNMYICVPANVISAYCYSKLISNSKTVSLFLFNKSTKAMSLQNGKIILARFIRDFVLDHKTGRSRQYGPVIVQSLLRFPFFFQRISELYLKYVHTIIVFRSYIDRRIYTMNSINKNVPWKMKLIQMPTLNSACQMCFI